MMVLPIHTGLINGPNLPLGLSEHSSKITSLFKLSLKVGEFVLTNINRRLEGFKVPEHGYRVSEN